MSQNSEAIRSISLSTLLQMLALDKATCAVEIHEQDDRGTLFIDDGELIHAEAGELEPAEAARRLTSLPSPSFRLRVGARAAERTLYEPLMRFLLRVAHENDEALRPPRDSAPAPRPAPVEAPPIAAPPSLGSPLSRLLEEFAERLPELIASDIVHVDSGLSIAGVSRRRDFDASLAAASAAEIVKANRRAARMLGLEAEATEDILTTTRDLLVLIRMIGVHYCQVVAVGGGGNLGLARAWMQSFQPRLFQAVAWLG